MPQEILPDSIRIHSLISASKIRPLRLITRCQLYQDFIGIADVD